MTNGRVSISAAGAPIVGRRFNSACPIGRYFMGELPNIVRPTMASAMAWISLHAPAIAIVAKTNRNARDNRAHPTGRRKRQIF